MTKTMNIPIFIPHNGCPNDCVFCNQRSISGVKQSEELEKVRDFIEESIQSANGRRDIEIAFFGGSFTGLDQSIQKSYLDLGKEFVEQYNLKGIRMSTRPDYISDEIISFLQNYPVTAIELGVQSLNKEVLDATKRNHSLEDVTRAVTLIKGAGIELGLQMMIGLPKDCLTYVRETMEQVIAYEPKTLRIYPTLVIKDTELEIMYKQGLYKPLSLDEAVMQVAEILPEFLARGITILRVGLQANEGLNSGDYIAGPYHPAFKELVMDQIIYNRVIQELENLNIETKLSNEVEHQSLETLDANNKKDVIILGNNKMYNRLIGHKKNNKTAFESLGYKLGLDPNLDNDLIQIRSIQGSTVFTIRF